MGEGVQAYLSSINSFLLWGCKGLGLHLKLYVQMVQPVINTPSLIPNDQ